MNNLKMQTTPASWKETLKLAGTMVAVWAGLFVVGGGLSLVATAFGCTVNEGMTQPCRVASVDIRDFLAMVTVGPMLAAAFGSPFFLVALVFLLLRAAVQYLSRDRSVKQ